MRKVFVALTGVGLCTSVAFAETEELKLYEENKDVVVVSENFDTITYNDTVYVPVREEKVDFFIGLELPLLSCVSSTVSAESYSGNSIDYSIENTDISINNAVLDNKSLLFGFSLNDYARIVFDVAHYSTETDYGIGGDNLESHMGVYGAMVDAIISKEFLVSPFVRVGVDYLTVEEEDSDFSALVFGLGFGVNYKMTENVFSYALLEYNFLPETDIDDTDTNIEAHSVSLSLGLGYRF